MRIEPFRRPPLITDYRIHAGTACRMAFCSDLHGCRNEPVLEVLEEIQPEAVLIGGDFIHDAFHFQAGFEFLRLCAQRWPVFCSIGNHELLYQGALRDDIRSTGVTLLDNSYTAFGGITIGGLSSALREQNNVPSLFHTTPPRLQWLEEFSRQDGFKLLLCHHPEYYPAWIRPLPIDLTLSGHAHGGQWRLFGRGAFAPGQGFFPKYTSGLYEGRLIVGRGLGNPTHIPRINNPPEILQIRLVPSESKENS